MTTVFVSWSGDCGQRVARVFADVLTDKQHASEHPIKVLLSPITFQVGGDWRSQLRRQLGQADLGVAVLEPAALRSPWVAYEAGFLDVASDTSAGAPRLFPFLLADSLDAVKSTPFESLHCAVLSPLGLQRFSEAVFADSGRVGASDAAMRLAETLRTRLSVEWSEVRAEESRTREGLLTALDGVVRDYLTFGLVDRVVADEIRTLLNVFHGGSGSSDVLVALGRELSAIARLFGECQAPGNGAFGQLASEWAIEHFIVDARQRLSDSANGMLPVRNRAPVRAFWIHSVFGRATESVWTTNTAKPGVTMGTTSDRHLLDAQIVALARGVKITRVFIYDPDMSDDEAQERRNLMQRQVEAGIAVSVITENDFRFKADAENATRRIGSDDFMLIDDAWVHLVYPATTDEIEATLVNGRRHSRILDAARAFRAVLDDSAREITIENVDGFPWRER